MLRHPSLKQRATMPLDCQWRLLGTQLLSHNPNPHPCAPSLCSFVLVCYALPSFCALFMFLVLLRPCPCSFTCAYFMFVLLVLFLVLLACILGGIHAHLSVSCRNVADRCRSLWLGQMVRSFMRMRCAPSSSVPTVSQRSSGSPSRAARTPPRVWPRQPEPLHPRQRP